MMGGDEDELKNRIRKAEEDRSTVQTKLIDTKQFKSKREIVMGESEPKYM